MASSSDSSGDTKKPRAGRIRHDSTGRAIWEWAADTGRHALDSTSRLLKRLDLPGLSLVDDTKNKDNEPPMFGGPKEVDPLQDKRKSFNPYDSRYPAKIERPPPTTRSGKPTARPVTPASGGFFSRLFGRKR